MWDAAYGYVLSILSALTFAKLIRLLRFNKRLSLFGDTLRDAAPALAGVLVMWSILFMAFLHGGFLLLSASTGDFRSVYATGMTLWNVGLGMFDFQSFQGNSFWGPVLFMAYMVLMNMIFLNLPIAVTAPKAPKGYRTVTTFWGPVLFMAYMVLMNMIFLNFPIAIITESFQSIKHDNDLRSNDHEIVDFLIGQLGEFVGRKERMKVKVHPAVGTENDDADGEEDKMENLDDDEEMTLHLMQELKVMRQELEDLR
ncbi:polycystin-2-like [Branchiostoma lanceolatum]|uniref:polycystin-2-like n=1 Tax=Branchiostoma lanceolatum TaxID=7740 RepID=UPI003455C199